MGRLSKALNCPERWRVWSAEGLDFLLAEPGSALRTFIDAAKEQEQAKQIDAAGKVQQQGAQISAPTTAAPRVGTQLPAGNLRAGSELSGKFSSGNSYSGNFSAKSVASEHSQEVTPNFPTALPAMQNTYSQKSSPLNAVQGAASAKLQAPPQQPQLQKAEAPTPAPLGPDPLEPWPAPWSSFATKITPNCPLLWTYWELGEDLCGTGNPARSVIIRKLIGALNLPKGSSNFWPHSTTGPEGITPEHAMFQRGVKAINPKFILVFGQKALQALLPERTCEPCSYSDFGGKILLFLPDMADMTDEAVFDKCVSFLQPFMRACFIGGA